MGTYLLGLLDDGMHLLGFEFGLEFVSIGHGQGLPLGGHLEVVAIVNPAIDF
jgi:hypothetical protein